MSRVLNAPETVNRDARSRVEAAVRELGYTRNGAARALRSRRSRIVGLILPTLRQPIYAAFIESLQEVLARNEHSLLIASSDDSLDRELEQARTFAEHGIDGLVLIGHTHRPALATLLDAQDLPFVTAYTFRPEIDQPVMGFDNAAGMAAVVDHLHGLGHRSFAVLAGNRTTNDRVDQRIRGVVQALAHYGLVLPAARLVEVPFSFEDGREGLARLVETREVPTALVCTSDVLAHGVLIEGRVRGIMVPAELSVTGYDDLQSSAHMQPALTSLAVPAREMGRRAGEYLLARFAGGSPQRQMQFETRLMVRDTTAAPPRAGAIAAEDLHRAGQET